MTDRWLGRADIYRHFGREYEMLDWTDEAAEQMFRYESRGGAISERNGFLQGKRMMDLMQKEWARDIADGLLFKCELQNDESFPACVCEWIDGWLPAVRVGRHGRAREGGRA